MPDMETEIESQVSQYCFCVKFFFQENQIIKHSKEIQNALFWGDLCPNRSKNKTSPKLRLSIL